MTKVIVKGSSNLNLPGFFCFFLRAAKYTDLKHLYVHMFIKIATAVAGVELTRNFWSVVVQCNHSTTFGYENGSVLFEKSKNAKPQARQAEFRRQE